MEYTLRAQAQAIYDAYVLGNKATARAMFAQVPHQRKAYVTMWFMGVAATSDDLPSAVRFIMSVTK
jgi:hypothetical protein